MIKDVNDVERTVNYIQFQINQMETQLAEFYNTDKPKICYVHLIQNKKALESELYELRKSFRRK